MASYNELNALIDAYINRNGVQAITGQILNGVLKAMVEQLGRGYTIMGAATPTTDPGTPDGPECYFASAPGTYTDFDGLQVVPGELALLCYTPTDGWTKATIYEGFRQVGATIDGNVGTPSVGVSYANGVLSFDFHNMKGNPGQNGQDGQDGDPAGFGTIGADITGGVGTPGVSVESSGPATAKNLQFHFTNLKGETGVTSVVATVDNTSGTPSCAVSLQGQQLTLAFTGLKGAQGNTGVSADYPIAIINNLTTDDPASALSAAQGVVLDGKVSQLEAKVTNLKGDILNGGSISERVFGHSDFTSAQVSLPSTITLAQVGDFVEMKAKTTDSTLIMHPAAYNQPYIGYSSATSISMRLIGVNGATFTCSTGVSRGTLQTIKLILDSISEGVRTFKLYIDGVERATNNPISVNADVMFSLAGGSSGTTMELYYIDGRTNGTDFHFDKFSEYTINTGSVEDVYDDSGTQTFSGLFQDEQDIAELKQADIETGQAIQNLGNDIDGLMDGMEIREFVRSDFSAQTPSISVDTALFRMSQVGDYVEIKVNANGTNGAILDKVTSYNNPIVKYSASNTLQIRFTQSINFTSQNGADWNAIQVIKILVTAVNGTTFTYEVYIDGVKIGTQDATEFLMDIIGWNSVMSLYYIKTKIGGIESTLERFSEMQGAVGVTDQYTEKEIDGVTGLNERTDTLEAKVEEIDSAISGDSMYYEYHHASGLWMATHDFRIYQRLKGNLYIMTAVIYYNSEGGVYPKGYWRMERTRLVSIVDGVVSLIQDQIITGGENEFVLKWLAGADYNADGGFTGGYHFGEKIDGVTGAWIEFIVNGNKISPAEDITLTPCKSFLYREYSAIYNCHDNPESIGAWHLKETEFKDGGYETINDVKFVQALDYFAYPGIVCVSRWLSEKAMPEGVATITDMGDGSTTIAEQFKSNGHRIHYEGNGYMCDVESEVLIGADDAQCQRVVYNSSAYNKYYRRNPDTVGSTSNRLKGRTKVKISAMYGPK